jgi:hypothetical protein
MNVVLQATFFFMDRVRTLLLAMSLIILMKIAFALIGG